jgi:hypothetical protein
VTDVRWCEETKAIALPAATFAEEFEAISERVALRTRQHEDLLPRCEASCVRESRSV